MKLTKQILIGAGLMLSLSCGSDFLDREPQQNITDTEYLKSLKDFQSAIFGGYDQMQSSNWYGRYFLLVPDVMGEDVKQNASANRAKEWAEYNGTFTNFIPEDVWKTIYEGINIANTMINAEYEPLESNKTEFNNILGQAYMLRAVGHFDLVRLYAQHYTYTADASHLGVPVVTAYDPMALPSRNTVAEVYTQVLSDLITAEDLMTIDPSNAGYFSKEAAQAMLSRVYLYMEDYENAEAKATDVIDSQKYELATAAAYPSMFLEGNSSEAIVEMVYSITDNPGSDHLGGMYKATGYGDYLPAKDLLDMMDDNDVRKTMFMSDPKLSGVYCCLRVNKYPSSGSQIGTDNIPVIRLSEVYLNRAEARARMNDFIGARSDLQLIRQRANPDAVPLTLTGDALTEEILKERRRELCFEGHRIFDITRNKQDMVREDCTSTICEVTYPNDRFILPIPDGETNANDNIDQNPDYY